MNIVPLIRGIIFILFKTDMLTFMYKINIMKINNQKVKSLALLSLIGSGLGKKEKSTSKSKTSSPSAISLDSLPKLAANLTAGGNETEPTVLFAGMPIFFRDPVAGDQLECGSGFAVVKSGSEECEYTGNNDYFGLLTSTRCCKKGGCAGTTGMNEGNDVFLFSNITNSQKKIGTVVDTTFASFNGAIFPDFALLGVNELDITLTPYVIGDKEEIYPVVGTGSVTIGSAVCAYGAVSGFLCGNIVEMGVDVTAYTPLNQLFGSVNKIENLGIGFYDEKDIGGPVYTISKIRDQTVAQALGYITSFDNSDYNHRILYYTPLDNAFKRFASVVDNNNCAYDLMIYNLETSTEEFQAQIEIPAKK